MTPPPAYQGDVISTKHRLDENLHPASRDKAGGGVRQVMQ